MQLLLESSRTGALHLFLRATRSFWQIMIFSLVLGSFTQFSKASKNHKHSPSFPEASGANQQHSEEDIRERAPPVLERYDISLLTPPPSPASQNKEVMLASSGKPISEHAVYIQFDQLVNIFLQYSQEIATQLVINKDLLMQSREDVEKVIRDAEQINKKPETKPPTKKSSKKKRKAKSTTTARSPPADYEMAQAYSIKASLVLLLWARSIQDGISQEHIPAQFKEFLEKAFSYHPETTLSFLHCWLGQWHTFRRKPGPGGLPIFPPMWLRWDAANSHFQQVYQLAQSHPHISQPAVFWIEALLHFGLISGLEPIAALNRAPVFLQKTREAVIGGSGSQYPHLYAPIFFSYIEQTMRCSVRPADPEHIARLKEDLEKLEAGRAVTKETDAEDRIFFEGKHAVKVSALLANTLGLSEYRFIPLGEKSTQTFFVDNLKNIVLGLTSLPNTIRTTFPDGDKAGKMLTRSEFIEQLEKHSTGKLHPQAQALMLVTAALLLYQQAESYEETVKAAGLYFRAVEKGFFHGMALIFRPKLQRYNCFDTLAKVYNTVAWSTHMQLSQRGSGRSSQVDLVNFQQYSLLAQEYRDLAKKQEKEKLEILKEDLKHLLLHSSPKHKSARTGQYQSPPGSAITLKRSLSVDNTHSPEDKSLSRIESDIDISRLRISSPNQPSSRSGSSTQSLHTSSSIGSKRSIQDIEEEDGTEEWDTIERKRIKKNPAEFYSDLDPRLHWNWNSQIKVARKLALAFRNHELFGKKLPDQIRQAAIKYGLDEISILRAAIGGFDKDPGSEILYEELAWGLMWRRNDPALHSSDPPQSLNELRSSRLTEARAYLATALDRKLRQKQGTISQVLSQKGFISTISDLIVAERDKFTDPILQFHFMEGVKFIVSSLGHNFRYLSESGEYGQYMATDHIANLFFQMKSLCPPGPEYAGITQQNRE